MGSKYSKLLYELLKDYSNLNEFVIDFSILKALLNVDNKDNPSIDNWSIFNRDILKRAVKEVSEKSDINVEYEPIKNIIDGKKQVDKIKFTIIKQKSKLIDYDLNPALKEYITDTLVVSSESKTDDYDPLELNTLIFPLCRIEFHLEIVLDGSFEILLILFFVSFLSLDLLVG